MSSTNNPDTEHSGQVWASPQEQTDPFPIEAELERREAGPHQPPSPVSRRHSYPARKQSKEVERPHNGGVPLRMTGTRGSRRPGGKSTLQEIREHTSMLLKPERPPPPDRPAPTWGSSLKAVVTATWLNLLLVCIPVGWALHFTTVNPVIVFVFTFLAIIPLAKLLAFATEEIAMRVGQTLGGLLNATLGNAVELIVAIIALAQCKLTIVQSSLVGSILSNLLLVLGMCFFAGGTKYSEQGFLVAPAQLNSSLLVLSVIGVLLPAAFNMAITSSNNSDNNTNNDVTPQKEGHDILQMSHGVAVILLILYICNLIFQLWSHANVLNEVASKSTAYPETVNFKYQANRFNRKLRQMGKQGSKEDEEVRSDPGRVTTSSTNSQEQAAAARRRVNNDEAEKTPGQIEAQGEEVEEEEEEVEYPTMNLPMCVIVLILVTVLVGVTAEFLVNSIDGVTATGHISEEWVGLILLPIVGNAAEHVTAVTVSVKNKLDLSMGVAVGSSIQIALFVIPFIVVLAWIMGKPLTMLFDPFESVVLFLSVLTVNYVVADGRSNWLEGMILMNLYVIVAVAFWFYPGFSPSTTLGLTCS